MKDLPYSSSSNLYNFIECGECRTILTGMLLQCRIQQVILDFPMSCCTLCSQNEHRCLEQTNHNQSAISHLHMLCAFATTRGQLLRLHKKNQTKAVSLNPDDGRNNCDRSSPLLSLRDSMNFNNKSMTISKCNKCTTNYTRVQCLVTEYRWLSEATKLQRTTNTN